MLIISLLLAYALSAYAAEQKDIELPKIDTKIGMNVLQAMEIRAASRRYYDREVPLNIISTILWAGNGIILKEGNKTVHGYDAVSGATGL